MEKVFIVFLGVLFSLILLDNGKSHAKVYVPTCHYIINYLCNAKSNQDFNTPPPGANLRHLTIFCFREVGNLTGKPFHGVGNLFLGGVGNIIGEVTGFK